MSKGFGLIPPNVPAVELWCRNAKYRTFSRNENQQTQHVQPQPQPTTTLKSAIGQH
jgi:hypothetical protein